MKPIAKLEEGDYVLSRDELTGDVPAKSITHKFINWHDGDVRELTIKTWLGDEELIITSDEQPFWVNAEGLRKSDQLVSLDNRILLVQSNTRIAESIVMYNFEIAEYHTFAVSDEQVWVHNAKKPCNEHGGGKNSKHANEKKRQVATEKHEQAKAEFDRLDTQTNKTPKMKKVLDKAKIAMNKAKRDMDFTGEHHSQRNKK